MGNSECQCVVNDEYDVRYDQYKKMKAN